jgi:hypothetical protein
MRHQHEGLGFDRGHRTLRIIGKDNKPAVIPLVPRTARTIDLAVGERDGGAILLRHEVNVSIVEPHIVGCDRSANALGWVRYARTCCEPHSSWPLSTAAFPCVTYNSRRVTPTRA